MRYLGTCILVILMIACQNNYPHAPFMYQPDAQPRWSSFENLNGVKGAGGQENHGAKGHAYDHLPSGERINVLDVEGPGIINRMWFTLSDRSPRDLGGLSIRITWDQEATPAVDVPFGDFFALGLSSGLSFENALFASPEGRSFTSYLSMPFKKHAHIELVNELDKAIDLVFFDIDYQLISVWDENMMYLHAYWHRDTATTLGQDFELLPAIQGAGRYLGTSVTVFLNPRYANGWFGEGEVKVYLDGDDQTPTLVGTGTEDYIGTGWGQGPFVGQYQGCTVADKEKKLYSFYRFHLPDPIYFHQGCRVTIQQMGGDNKANLQEVQASGAPLIPVEIIAEHGVFHPIYEPGKVVDLSQPDLPGTPDSWVNYYRSDDVAAISYFYLMAPAHNLPALQGSPLRTAKTEME